MKLSLKGYALKLGGPIVMMLAVACGVNQTPIPANQVAPAVPAAAAAQEASQTPEVAAISPTATVAPQPSPAATELTTSPSSVANTALEEKGLFSWAR